MTTNRSTEDKLELEDESDIEQSIYVRIPSEEEKLTEFRKNLRSKKTSDEILEFLLSIDTFDRFELELIDLLKTNSAFKKHFCEDPGAFLLENHLFNYCVKNPDDKEMQAIKVEYEKAQHSPGGLQKHDRYFTELLRKEYKFPEPLTKEQEDLIHVAMFLMDDRRVIERLKEIEAIIEKKAKEEDKLEKEEKQLKLKGYNEDEAYKDDKFLSGLFKDLSKQFGFGAVIKISERLSGKNFKKILEAKNLFKDKSEGGYLHGEWTHFIQWLCIALEYTHHRFLHNHPTALLGWLGSDRGRGWFRTFEGEHIIPRQKSARLFDARRIDEFNSYMIGTESASLLPLLHQLLTGRANKRELVKQGSSTLTVLSQLCDTYPKNEKVKELGNMLSQGDTNKRTLMKFVGHFQKHRKEYPKEFAAAVGKKISPSKKG